LINRWALNRRIEQRAAWLQRSAEELSELVSRVPADDKSLQLAPWRELQVIRFQTGWALGRVRTSHEDEGRSHLELGGGLGDIAVLVDDQGRVRYSRRHWCSGQLPGSAFETFDASEMVPAGVSMRNAATFDEYLGTFDSVSAWTSDCAAAADDRRPRGAPAR
jgi:hypothetical protein